MSLPVWVSHVSNQHVTLVSESAYLSGFKLLSIPLDTEAHYYSAEKPCATSRNIWLDHQRGYKPSVMILSSSFQFLAMQTSYSPGRISSGRCRFVFSPKYAYSVQEMVYQMSEGHPLYSVKSLETGRIRSDVTSIVFPITFTLPDVPSVCHEIISKDCFRTYE